jgi:serine/threonine protein kinase/Flp pilus assembly protein TadD
MNPSARPIAIPDAPSRSVENPQFLVYGQVAEEVNACLRAGREPDVDALVARHPEMAGALREMVGALVLLNGFGQSAETSNNLALLPAGEPLVLGQLGDFQIVREIGRGGMGVVYEAVQISLGRRVALKVLPFAATLDPKALQRFKNEAQMAAQLHHTNIVPVISVGCERGVHYYAMQFIEGQTLAAVIEELRRTRSNDEGRMTNDQRSPNAEARRSEKPEETPPGFRHSTFDILSSLGFRHSSFFRIVASLGVQAAEALEHAHQLGVVHRDIKPANLLVDLRSNLWITDFGLAHCQGGPHLTLTGDILGTLRYMSPEQSLAKRMPVDARTDVYSLGATLYELLTLEPAYNGRNREEVLRQIAFEEPRLPSRLNQAVPVELETIVLKAMAKNPQERYAAARELADDLRRFLEDRPIQAKRPTLRQRTAKWARRHRGIVTTAAGTLFVSLLLGVLGLVWSNIQLRQEQEHTDAARRHAERNLALAVQTLEEVFLRLGDRPLLRDPRPDGSDGIFLDCALHFYEELASDNGEDPRVRKGLASAWGRLGSFRELLGQYQAAQEAYDRAISLSERLAAEYPHDLIPRWVLASSHLGLGHILNRTGHPRAAAEHCRAGLDLWSWLAVEFPAELECRRELALGHNELASQLAQRGNPSAAEHHHRQALALRAQLDAESPGRVEQRYDLAASHHHLADLLRETGRCAEAETHYRQALALVSQLTSEFPATPLYRSCLALGYCALGDLSGRRSREEADRNYRRALDLQTRLVAEFPKAPEYREALASTHNSIGILACEQNDLQAGERHFRQALEIRTRLAADCPTVPGYRQAQASSHANLGARFERAQDWTTAERHYRQALELQLQLAKELSAEPWVHHDLAATYFNLAKLRESMGDWDGAEQHYRQALCIQAKLAGDVPSVPKYQNQRASLEEFLGNLLWATGEKRIATDHFRRAFTIWTELMNQDASGSDSSATLADFARFLATCPAEQFRDANRALALARRAVDQAPARWIYWSTLGLTLYRSGDADAALAALAKACQLHQGEDAIDEFFKAMAYAQLGKKAQARQCYTRAASFAERNRAGNEWLRRLRAEAAGRLGLGKEVLEIFDF